MDYFFEESDGLSRYSFKGNITAKSGDALKVILMKAIHSIERVVMNFKHVITIDEECLELLRRAYLTSVRLHNPIILTSVPVTYRDEIYKDRFIK